MINQVVLTGFLPGDAIARCSPGGSRRLDFDVRTTDSKGGESVQKVFVEDVALMAKLEPKLEAGAAVVVLGELTSRPFESNGVVRSYVREVRALKVDVPRI
jgi:hypothetical protein